MPQSLTLNLIVAGELQVRRRFAGVLANTEDLSPALERIADVIEAHLEQVFDTEGAATKSGAWSPLNEAYEAHKRKHYGAGLKILEREKELRAVMTDAGHSGHIREISKDTLIIGGRRPAPKNPGRDLALTHQKGGGSLPARPILDLPEAEKRKFVQILREHLNAEKHRKV